MFMVQRRQLPKCLRAEAVKMEDAHGYLVLIRTSTDMPGRSSIGNSPAGRFCVIDILTGTRCVIFVKFPDALPGGIRENCDAVDLPMLSTLPANTMPGKASIRARSLS